MNCDSAKQVFLVAEYARILLYNIYEDEVLQDACQQNSVLGMSWRLSAFRVLEFFFCF